MKTTKILSAILCMVLVFTLAGCGLLQPVPVSSTDTGNNENAGSWAEYAGEYYASYMEVTLSDGSTEAYSNENTDSKTNKNYMFLREDGTFELVLEVGGTKDTGTYAVDGNKLILTYDGDYPSDTLEYNGDTIRIEFKDGDGGTVKMTLTKKAGQSTSTTTANSNSNNDGPGIKDYVKKFAGLTGDQTLESVSKALGIEAAIDKEEDNSTSCKWIISDEAYVRGYFYKSDYSERTSLDLTAPYADLYDPKVKFADDMTDWLEAVKGGKAATYEDFKEKCGGVDGIPMSIDKGVVCSYQWVSGDQHIKVSFYTGSDESRKGEAESFFYGGHSNVKK